MKSIWSTKKLGEICEERKEKNIYNENLPVFTVSHIYGLVSYQNIFYKQVHSKDTKNYKIVNRYDFAFGLPTKDTLPYGILENEEKVLISPAYIVFSIKDKNLLFPRFLYYLLKTNYYKWKIIEIAKSQSATRHGLPLKFYYLANLEIPLPPLPIQQKIVKILDSIQEAVEIQEKIIDKTKELKKSLMAELFKYGASSFRKGRKLKKTEIGEIPEDWEVVRLGEVCEKVISGDWGKGEKYPNSRSCKVIRGTDFSLVQNGKLTNFPNRYVDERKFEKLKLKYGDILIEISGGSEDQPTGRILLWNKNENLSIIFSNFVKKILLNVKLVKPEYFFRYWQFLYFKGATKNYEERTTNIRNFKFKEFLENEKLSLPSLSEQQEIAEILQTIDQKIEIEQKKKELYEELFKTMLNKIMNQEIDVEKIEI